MTKGSEFEFRQDQEFSRLHVIEIDSAVHPTSYPVGREWLFLQGVKRLGRQADHAPPASAEVKKI
jgi:hypothetical protein